MPDATTAPEDLGIYVHVPFCERVCPYCDFAVEAVGALDASLEDPFAGDVLRELELAGRDLADVLERRLLATVYLGGGTPSLLRPDSVELLLRELRRVFPGEPAEVTLELNPGPLEVARVRGFVAAGVTRFSVGVQSFDDDVLRRLGRAQSGAEARRGLEVCLASGARSVSADLMFGAPGQSEARLFADLGALAELGVPHVSAYALTLEPDTPFARARERGRLDLPDEDRVLAMSRGLRARLAAAGLEQYEISSFARPGHRSRHNQRYWQRRAVLGLGPSAATLLDGRRWTNARVRSVWRTALAEGRRALEECETISERDARRETLYLGFRRLAGVSRAAYLRRFGAPPEADFGAEIEELRKLELIADAGGHLRLTERGILFADEVFLRFVGR